MFTDKDNKNIDTLSKELSLAIDREDVDELGFPRKRLTETQREYVNKLYKREAGLNGATTPTTKAVIFDSIKRADPFGLKTYQAVLDDEPDNKWWHRWNAWLENKRKEKEEREKKAAEQARILHDAVNKQQQQKKV